MTSKVNDSFQKERKNLFLGLIFVILLGLLTSKVSTIAFVWAPTVFAIGLYLTVKTRNSFGVAHLFAAYIMGAEVYFRMSWSGLPWDFAKYAIILLLFTGLLIDRRDRKLPILMFGFISEPITLQNIVFNGKITFSKSMYFTA